MKKKLKELLADYLGVGIEDINDNDSLTQDLHMSAIDLTDFVNGLNEHFDTSHLDLSEVETFEDLLVVLDIHE